MQVSWAPSEFFSSCKNFEIKREGVKRISTAFWPSLQVLFSCRRLCPALITPPQTVSKKM